MTFGGSALVARETNTKLWINLGSGLNARGELMTLLIFQGANLSYGVSHVADEREYLRPRMGGGVMGRARLCACALASVDRESPICTSLFIT